jgi:hypothetical protein
MSSTRFSIALAEAARAWNIDRDPRELRRPLFALLADLE